MSLLLKDEEKKRKTKETISFDNRTKGFEIF